jgi:putative copper export protein
VEPLVEAIDIAGLALLVGVAAVWLWLAPAPAGGFPREGLPRGWFGAALILLAFGSVMGLWLRASALVDAPLAQAWRAIPGVMLHSDFGRLWMLRLAALIVLIALWLWRRDPPPRGMAALTAVVTAFVLSATGHMGDQGPLTGDAVNNTLHVFAGCLWGGAVVIYALSLLPGLRRGQPSPTEIADTAARLSTLAAVALALVALTGLYNAWLLVGSIPALWRTDYGRILLVKLAFVAAMAGLGAFNRFVAVPSVQAWARPPQLSPRADAPVQRFLRLLRIDVVLFAIIVLAAAVLANSTPSVHQ